MYTPLVSHALFILLSLLFSITIFEQSLLTSEVDIGVSSQACDCFHYEREVPTINPWTCQILPVLNVVTTSVKTDDWDAGE
jgi:hypothetical protein